MKITVPAARRLVTLLLGAALVACGGGSSSQGGSCNLDERSAALDAALAQAPSEVDFSFAAQRADGRRYVYQRGRSSLQTVYESASTSKLVSAVIILRQVERGHLRLEDRPQDRIASWDIPSTDPLYGLTLAQLLSFSSGLIQEPSCLLSSFSDFESCVLNIARLNAGHGQQPGVAFFYGNAHLQVAGLMAVKASGLASWQALFDEFKAQTGLFPTARYDLPSTGNPRLAGGMHWNGDEYLAFLRALQAGELLGRSLMAQMLSDQIAGLVIANSPTRTGFGEDWHYGFGLWHECESAQYDCVPGERVSSPGAYGAYPYWDRPRDYFGLVARQGMLGTYPNGIAIERAVRAEVEAWVDCD